MLMRSRAALMGIITLALTLVFWTILGTAYGVWERTDTTGLRPELSLSDLRIFLLLGASFMALSGYLITVPLLYAFYDHRRSWIARALTNAGLFLVHVAVLALLIGSSVPGGTDATRILLGVTGVFAGEASTRLLCRKWGHARSG